MAGPSRRRGGVAFTLFGFSVSIDPSFFIVIVVLGLFPGATARTVVIWTVVAAVSILIHELGHAFAARRLGSEPSIELYSFGGLTHWQPAPDASRWHLISVALAGPFAGVCLGALVALGALIAGGTGTGDVRFFVIVMLWINLGWGLVNLLPVLPLDGGHVLAELLPGERATRWRRAAIVSIVTGVVAGVVLIAIGYYFGAIVFGWAVATNITTVRNEQRRDGMVRTAADANAALEALRLGRAGAVMDLQRITATLPRSQQSALKSAAAETAAIAGRVDEADLLLARLPGDAAPALYALVSATRTAGAEGIDELIEIFEREPNAVHARWLTVGLHRSHRLEQVVEHMHRVPPTRRSADSVEAAAAIADWVERPDVAIELRRLATV